MIGPSIESGIGSTTEEGRDVSEDPTPDQIMQVGLGFWASPTVLYFAVPAGIWLLARRRPTPTGRGDTGRYPRALSELTVRSNDALEICDRHGCLLVCVAWEGASGDPAVC